MFVVLRLVGTIPIALRSYSLVGLILYRAILTSLLRNDSPGWAGDRWRPTLLMSMPLSEQVKYTSVCLATYIFCGIAFENLKSLVCICYLHSLYLV